MRTRSSTFLMFVIFTLALLFLCHPLPTHAAQPDPNTPTAWSAPSVIWPEAWDNPHWFDVDDSGTRLVSLIFYGGPDKNHRPIQVSEYASGAWQTPVTIATNGHYSDENFQVLPQRTTPVISGDGETIAYTGWNGTTYSVYIVDRNGGAWAPPVLLNTGLDNHHYWVSLSDDGDTVAYSSYPFLDTRHVYISTRSGPGQPWHGPHQISATTGANQGGNMPDLSGDGSKIVFVSNAQLMFSERIGSQWSAPEALTNNLWSEFEVDNPQLSTDGLSIFYWLITKVPTQTGYLLTEQNLYIIRRSGTGWRAPQRVNGSPLLPDGFRGGPAAADDHATRLIYQRPVPREDPDGNTYVETSQLEISEWRDGTWQSGLLVDATGWGNFNWWPHLSPDGLQLTFNGEQRDQRYGTLWQMTTADAPPAPPSGPVVVGQNIPTTGGSLISPADQTDYLFGADTFTDTVTVRHVVEPTLRHPAPAGMAGIGHCFWVAAILNATGEMAQPGVPVTVTIDYSDTGLGPTLPGTLDLWRWDEETNVWTLDAITCQDDAANQRMICQISHFSTFALLGESRSLFLPMTDR